MRIGVLGFQGAIIEHQRHIATLGHKPVVVRYPEQLKELDGIILPGGESTTMGKLLVRTVRRNAYGRQIDSFDTSVNIPEVSPEEIPLVFIRAPYITAVGEGVQELCRLDGHVVAAREGNMLVTSFHPELTDNDAFHWYFAAMCAARRKQL